MSQTRRLPLVLSLKQALHGWQPVSYHPFTSDQWNQDGLPTGSLEALLHEQGFGSSAAVNNDRATGRAQTELPNDIMAGAGISLARLRGAKVPVEADQSGVGQDLRQGRDHARSIVPEFEIEFVSQVGNRLLNRLQAFGAVFQDEDHSRHVPMIQCLASRDGQSWQAEVHAPCNGPEASIGFLTALLRGSSFKAVSGEPTVRFADEG
jgi:hypothetical protein